MRIISLCVEGIHQAAQRGLYDWLGGQDADIICLQDLRALEYELDDDIFHPEGYNAYFFDSAIKNYNGVAIYSRLLPKALIYGLNFRSGLDMEGRYLQVDFEHISIGSLLAPSATDQPGSQDIKIGFFDEFQAHLHKVAHKRRNFIFCGNWAIAPKSEDVNNLTSQQHKSGFLPIEQQWMQQLFKEIDYYDAFRLSNNDEDEYSWWPSGKIGEGDAWRTDLQIISANLRQRIEYAVIYKKQLFSNHLPVIIDYDIELQQEL